MKKLRSLTKRINNPSQGVVLLIIAVAVIACSCASTRMEVLITEDMRKENKKRSVETLKQVTFLLQSLEIDYSVSYKNGIPYVEYDLKEYKEKMSLK